ncbi:SGNH/GDSL hydrolase family protein [Singulisphaera sp. PoT]|uniref:SGNH/GDSL hydrolase family protein n=1 Tax=Singulisphaera sp. PoT TaxID=3411797 RepID=UPI003BF551D2
MRRFLCLLSGVLLCGLVGAPSARGADPADLAKYRRILFLGDSNTYAGQWVEYVEAYLRLHVPGFHAEVLNLGLPSETVSGLSEPGHAGGAFPRPVLSERLDRVLDKVKPDLVVACYGMNCGMYYPPNADRLGKFEAGIKHLREKASACGAMVVHVTPPVFDPGPIRSKTLPAGLPAYTQPYEGYDEFLKQASDWLLSQRANGWEVVDVHGPMTRFLERGRSRDPKYHLAADGVHINGAGHWLIARAVLAHWGFPTGKLGDETSAERVLAADPGGTEVLKLVQRRQRLLKDAWLTETGHKRPGMNRGVPLDEARREAQKIEAELEKAVARPAG